jgi:hypothetical protein
LRIIKRPFSSLSFFMIASRSRTLEPRSLNKKRKTATTLKPAPFFSYHQATPPHPLPPPKGEEVRRNIFCNNNNNRRQLGNTKPVCGAV